MLYNRGIFGGPKEETFESFPIKSEHSLDQTITTYHRSNYFYDGVSENNLAICRFTEGEHKHDWRGPITLISQRSTLHPSQYQDITVTDLQNVRDFLLSYGEGLEDSLRFGALRALELSNPLLWEEMMFRFFTKDVELVRGVRISCVGDMKILGLDQYIAVDIPGNHPIFANEDANMGIYEPPAATDLSAYMKALLLVRRTAVDWRWYQYFSNRDELLMRQDPTNEPAAHLTRISKVNHPDWGGNYQQNNHPSISGTVFVARLDKKPLTVKFVKSLVHVIQSYVAPMMESQKKIEKLASGERIILPRAREDGLYLATKEVIGGLGFDSD